MYHLASMATREGKRHMIKTILVDDEDIIREGLFYRLACLGLGIGGAGIQWEGGCGAG